MGGTGPWVSGMGTWHQLCFHHPPIYFKRIVPETGTWNLALTMPSIVWEDRWLVKNGPVEY